MRAVDLSAGLGDAVGARVMRVGGLDGLAAEAPDRGDDLGIAGRDHDLVNAGAEQDAPAHVLEHRQTEDFRQHLTGVAFGIKPGRDDDRDPGLHALTPASATGLSRG